MNSRNSGLKSGQLLELLELICKTSLFSQNVAILYRHYLDETIHIRIYSQTVPEQSLNKHVSGTFVSVQRPYGTTRHDARVSLLRVTTWMSSTLRRVKASTVTMMNEAYQPSHDPAAAPFFSNAPSGNAGTETVEAFVCPLNITDEEAELQLPGYSLAFEAYHKFRVKGESPEEALDHTLQEWRAMWRQCAFVPHRSS